MLRMLFLAVVVVLSDRLRESGRSAAGAGDPPPAGNRGAARDRRPAMTLLRQMMLESTALSLSGVSLESRWPRLGSPWTTFHPADHSAGSRVQLDWTVVGFACCWHC